MNKALQEILRLLDIPDNKNQIPRFKLINLGMHQIRNIDDYQKRELAFSALMEHAEVSDFFLAETMRSACEGNGSAQHAWAQICDHVFGDSFIGNDWENLALSDHTFLKRLNLINLHEYIDNVLRIKEQDENGIHLCYLMQMAGYNTDDITKIEKTADQIDTAHAMKIGNLVLKKIKKFVQEMWSIGSPINQTILEQLIQYINSPIENTDKKKLNIKNLKLLFETITKEYHLDKEDECFSADMDIFSEKFKRICNIHVYLPLEGEVTGIYFLERFFDMPSLLPTDYHPQIMDTVTKEANIKASNRRNDRSRKSSYKYKLREQYGIALENYTAEDVRSLGDLLEYIEYELLSSSKRETDKKTTKSLNLFKLLKESSWNIFEDFPVQDQEYKHAIIFLKSELLRKCEPRDIVLLRYYMWKSQSILPLSREGIVYSFINSDVLNEDTTYYDGKLTEAYDRMKRMAHTYKVEKGIRKEKNVFLNFLQEILKDKIRHSLKERYRNIQQVKKFTIHIDNVKRAMFLDCLTRREYDLDTSMNNLEKEFLIKVLDINASEFERLSKLIKQFLSKFDTMRIPLIIKASIYQLCLHADKILISDPISYKRTRKRERTLKSVLQPQSISNTGIRRVLAYLVEYQFYSNLGKEAEYIALSEFRIAWEEKITEIIFFDNSTELMYDLMYHILSFDEMM